MCFNREFKAPGSLKDGKWILDAPHFRFLSDTFQSTDLFVRKVKVVNKQTILGSTSIVDSETTASSFERAESFNSDDTHHDALFAEFFIRLARTQIIQEREIISVLELFSQVQCEFPCFYD
jgi:hypothetical protein